MRTFFQPSALRSNAPPFVFRSSPLGLVHCQQENFRKNRSEFRHSQRILYWQSWNDSKRSLSDTTRGWFWMLAALGVSVVQEKKKNEDRCVTIYLWLPRYDQPYGHLAIETPHTYSSFTPEGYKGHYERFFFLHVISSNMQHTEEDRCIQKKEPCYIYKLFNLDVEFLEYFFGVLAKSLVDVDSILNPAKQKNSESHVLPLWEDLFGYGSSERKTKAAHNWYQLVFDCLYASGLYKWFRYPNPGIHAEIQAGLQHPPQRPLLDTEDFLIPLGLNLWLLELIRDFGQNDKISEEVLQKFLRKAEAKDSVHFNPRESETDKERMALYLIREVFPKLDEESHRALIRGEFPPVKKSLPFYPGGG